ncbi:hypothetical protein Q0Z83_106910 [Actinoplanes sichuanensis]|nr:hypothetical protein Q0Z83_106910 [Actinoplanes sichuanensis]
MFRSIPSGFPDRNPQRVPIAAIHEASARWEAVTPWTPPTANPLDKETPCPRIAGRRSAGRRLDGAARRDPRPPHRHAPLLSGSFR